MSKHKSIYHTLGDALPLLGNFPICDEFTRLYEHYGLLARNRFVWKNLPNNIESRHIERALFSHGQAIFYKNKDVGFVCLPCSSSKEVNCYNEPTGYIINAPTLTDTVTLEEGVIIRDNDDGVPSKIHIIRYAEIMARLEKAWDINLSQQKFPFIIPTTADTKKSAEILMNKVEGDETNIFVDKTLEDTESVDGVKVLQTGVPFLLDKFQECKNNRSSELMTFLGINNNSSQKRERLLTDEVNSNNSEILFNLELGYEVRKQACDRINKMFGLNIEVVKKISELETDFIGSMKEGDDIAIQGDE